MKPETVSRGMLKKCQKNLKRWMREAELTLGNAEDVLPDF
jgi:hypothetical protein